MKYWPLTNELTLDGLTVEELTLDELPWLASLFWSCWCNCHVTELWRRTLQINFIQKTSRFLIFWKEWLRLSFTFLFFATKLIYLKHSKESNTVEIQNNQFWKCELTHWLAAIPLNGLFYTHQPLFQELKIDENQWAGVSKNVNWLTLKSLSLPQKLWSVFKIFWIYEVNMKWFFQTDKRAF